MLNMFMLMCFQFVTNSVSDHGYSLIYILAHTSGNSIKYRVFFLPFRKFYYYSFYVKCRPCKFKNNFYSQYNFLFVFCMFLSFLICQLLGSYGQLVLVLFRNDDINQELVPGAGTKSSNRPVM